MKPWSQEAVDAHLAKFKPNEKANHNPSVQTPKSESDNEHARVRKTKGYELGKRVCIRVTVKSPRPPDPDGIDAKAAIDGIVEAGVLRDDSTKEIKEVRFRSQVAKEDQTIIEIWEVEDDDARTV